MRARPAAILWTIFAIAVAGALTYLASRPPDPAPSPPRSEAQPANTPEHPSEDQTPVLAALPATRPVDPRMTPILNALQEYLSIFKEHPVGTNAEITAALLGDNPRKLIALPRAKATLDADGQLLDPWGKPYFFHQLSARTMELRSAGPDRTLRTDDDLLLISQDWPRPSDLDTLGGSGNEPHSDANGNMTEDQSGNDLAYDAWTKT